MSKTITVAEIAKSLKMEPKAARSRLRRHKDDMPKPVKKGAWEFPATAKTKIVKLLTA
jgi:hypothetical protein